MTGFCLIDADWRIVAVSTTRARIDDVDSESAVGRVLWDLFPQEVGSEFHERLHEAMERRVEVRFEQPGGPGGRVTEVMAFPAHDGIALITYDITDRKRLEEELGTARAQTEDLIAHAPTGIYEIGFNPPRFITVNDAMCVMSGYSRAELLGMDPFQLLETESRALFAERMRKTFEGEPISSDVEYGVIRKDGERITVVLHTRPVRDESGREVGAFVIGYDVTERTRAEGALRRSEQRFQLLSEANALLLSAHAPETMIQTIGERVMQHLGAEVFFNYVRDAECGMLRLNSYGGVPEELAESIRLLQLGQAICGCVARDGERVISEDVQCNGDPRADLVRSMGITSYVCHPLRIDGETVGTLSFGATDRTSFAPDEIDLMRTVADQISIAIERATAEKGLETELRRVRLLQEVGVAISSARTLDAIGEGVLDALDRLAALQCGSISMLDGDSLRLVAWRGYPPETVRAIESIPLSDESYLATRAVARNRILTHEDEVLDPSRGAHLRQVHVTSNRYAVVPIRSRRQVLGTLSIVFEARRAFGLEELDTYQLVADILGSSFQMALLDERERRAAELNEALTSIDNSIHSTLEPDVMLSRALVEATEALGCDSSAYDVRVPGGWVIHQVHGLPEAHVGQFVSGAEVPFAELAATWGEPVAIDDAFNDPRADAELQRAFNVRSVIVAPVIVRDAVEAVVFFNVHAAVRAFSAEDVSFVRRLTMSLGLAMENARLFDYQRRRRRKIETMHGVLEAAVESLDIAEAAQRMLEYVVRQETFDIASVWVVNGDLLEFVAGVGYSDEIRDRVAPIRLDSPCDLAVVCRTGQPYSAPDAEHGDPLTQAVHQEMGIELGAYLILPMESRGRVIGALRLAWCDAQPIDELDAAFYESIASEMGVVLENARLFEERTRQVTFAGELNEANAMLLSAEDFSDSWAEVLRLAGEWLGSSTVLLGSGEGAWSFERMAGDMDLMASEVSGNAVKRCAHRAWRHSDEGVEQRPTRIEITDEDGAAVYLAAASLRDTESPAVVVVARKDVPFSALDLEFLSRLVAQASIASREARLRREREWLSTARQQWLSGISHDLKTPLAAIRGYAELLADPRDVTAAEVGRQASIIVQQTRRIQSLIADMLLTFQIYEGELPMTLVKTDLTAMLLNLEEALVADPRSSGVRIIVAAQSEEHVSYTDERLLERAIQNVAINSLVHAEGVTTVTLSVSEAPGGWQEIEVIDDGLGMTDETLARIWKRYERGPGGGADTDGVGLGMSITRQLIEAMGGTVAIESSVGRGTTVTLRLPGASAAELAS